ncbi:MAG: glycogen/starch/alpha-glucan phosphorylase [Brucellaceae bacterium]|nr:glycogen/starch/alpha-glucan phosphorylase [Brucellaceae bacterium]
MISDIEKLPEPAPRSSDPAALAARIVERLTYGTGKDPKAAKPHDWLEATIHVVRDRIIDNWMQSTRAAYAEDAKRVYYLSLEFLIGRLLRDAISNLDLQAELRQALARLGVDFDMLRQLEPDAALGNGGLGRLAACFMESMASVGIPAYGYGIRYQHGLFRQEISDGWQVELPETWLSHGNPWEFERRESSYEIGFGGRVEPGPPDASGQPAMVWKPAERLIATAYDTPVVGWQAKRVNTLRLWSAVAIDPILLARFNAGDHVGALEESNKAEALTRVLYPADSHIAGQELRLRQEFFFSSASLQDILRRHAQTHGTFDNLADKVAIQLNDTHPAIAIAEMMRLLMDVHGYEFDKAWTITVATFAYTNHTLLPEALESWPVPLMERLFPRHMQIIYLINARALRQARKDGFDDGAISRISLIAEEGERRVRMGNLAFMGAHSINGVSALHTELMKKTVFGDLNTVFPGRINNKTNGITPRRWLMQCNPDLYHLVQEAAAGTDLMANTEALATLQGKADDTGFQDAFAAIKRQNKEQLARLVRQRLGLKLDPSALFDIQIKRIHEYKRQLLNLVEAVALYDQIRSHPERDWVPRVKFFAGKAAPSYHNAKLIIKLANDIARVINHDPLVGDLLKVVFMPNYNVSLAEVMVPAADLSEQISTAGMEASGTGNMKFGLNGALTIGTLDGANVEMREHVGADNIVIFGLTAAGVSERRAGGRNPRDTIAALPELAQALASIRTGAFSPGDPDRYKGLIDGIFDHDWFMLTDDFDDYCQAQRHVDALWSDRQAWNRKAILNTVHMGWFSSDRTIRQYAGEIWNVPTNQEVQGSGEEGLKA